MKKTLGENDRLNGQGEQFFGTTSDFSGDTYSGDLKKIDMMEKALIET